MPAPPSETPPRDPPRPRAARTSPRARRLLIGAALLAVAGCAAVAAGLWRGRDASLERVQHGKLLRAWNGALEQVLGSEVHRAVLSRFGFDPRELPARGASTR